MKNILIIHLPRSGSHSIFHTAFDQGYVPNMECFHHNCATFKTDGKGRLFLKETIEERIRTATNDKGAIIKFSLGGYFYISNLAGGLETDEKRIQLLDEIFGDWLKLFLVREDFDSMAVSYAFARLNQRWAIKDKPIMNLTEEDYDVRLIAKAEEDLRKMDRNIRDYHKRLGGHLLIHEEIMKDPSVIEQLTGIDCSRIRKRVDLISDPVKQEWVKRYKLRKKIFLTL